MKRLLRKLLRRRALPAAPGDAPRLVGLLREHRIDHVLDVGANRGQYALVLRAAGYRGRITSFEPLREAHAALLAAARGDPHWTVAPAMALGAQEGQAVMHVSHRSDMSSLLPIAAATLEAIPRAFGIGKETVELRRLDEILDHFVGPGERLFLKLDTQGSERAILAGAAGVIDRIAGLQVELSLFPLYEGEAPYLEILHEVEAHGFDAYLFFGGYFSKRLNRQLQMDGVFFRSSATPAP
jgi:FkbM family methyltransferase